jgi:hypothetical protein
MATLSFVKSSKPLDIKAKQQYATYSIRCSDLPDDEDTVKIHIRYFDTGTAEDWLEFLQSFKSLVQMKGWQQGAGVGPTIFRNLRILLQGTALSRFETHASTIGAQTVAHAFSCLDAMTSETFVLRPDKSIKKLIRETKKPETLTVNHYINRLQVLNNYLSFLPGDISPLTSSEIRDIIEENVPSHWKTKYENADLNLESIPELAGYFTRLEDLDRRREKSTSRANKEPDRSSRGDKERARPNRIAGKGDSKSTDTSNNKYCTFHKTSTHDTSECKAKKKLQDKKTSVSSQEVNVITPFPDNFCYEVSSSPSCHQTSSNLGYDSLFEADNCSTPPEESNVILQQGDFNLSTLPSPSPVTTPTSNEMRTEVLLAFQPNETGQPTLINCLIDTGCSKGLICETLVKDSEMLNRQVMNWKTKKGSFLTKGTAQKSYHIPASPLTEKLLLTLKSCLLECLRNPTRSSWEEMSSLI